MRDALALAEARGIPREDINKWIALGLKPGPRVLIRPKHPEKPVVEIQISHFDLEHPSLLPVTNNGCVTAKLVVRSAGARAAREVFREGISVVASGAGAVVNARTPARSTKLLSFDEERLHFWLRHRIGYGSLQARGWFLGLEEYCKTDEEIPSRLRGQILEDLLEAHRGAHVYADLFRFPDGRIENTWGPQIACWLAFCQDPTRRRRPDSSEILGYQATHWGRSGGDTLLAELLPLPSRSVDERVWPYTSSARPELQSRRLYTHEWLPSRISYLRELWRSRGPVNRLIIAYGRTYWDKFASILGLDLKDLVAVQIPDMQPNSKWAVGRRADDTTVALVTHPSYDRRDQIAEEEIYRRWIELGWALRDL